MSEEKKKEVSKLTKEKFQLEQRLSDPVKNKKWRELDQRIEQLHWELEHPDDN